MPYVQNSHATHWQCLPGHGSNVDFFLHRWWAPAWTGAAGTIWCACKYVTKKVAKGLVLAHGIALASALVEYGFAYAAGEDVSAYW